MPSKNFWQIPAGTTSIPCRSCDEEIWFIETSSGKKMPIDVTADGANPPTATSGGQGESHFANCSGAVHHRRAR